ncbi:N-acetylmuramoyl-L-alanine amidase [Octadecabacter ascidiaceicola]|uniref:N-acetylmuramoyl-L-alanine amidase n=1 Tax=Octadecabacter ascidiaceicola TaxID=1655543 RepID=A0A238JN58_9RHOB|nr:N-acetylmuramoyl-L-alanine amidase [Octadecabacter ascidiaceicola]SMX31644.1 N-acetylmuramoyl-L-alanine amidase AmiC precursor [Octadecabacter ascidiaceicola]
MKVFAKLRRVFCATLVLLGGAVGAQEFSALARLDVTQSGADDGFRHTEVELFLSQPVPYRVFTLDEPMRLVMDFREVDFRGADAGAFTQSDWISGARFGGLRPGWSRMIFDLSYPVRVDEAGMRVNEVDGTARIGVVLKSTSAEEFVAASGAPNDPNWAFFMAADPATPAPQADDGPLVIVIDPGHGGIDPGADVGGVHEADVMLALGLELAAALGRIEGVQPAITRAEDMFVPLQERLTLARGAGADLFISLHADALEGDQATGASVYTLTSQAAADASLRMAERHEKGDLLAGVDLTGQGDEVALILQDLVRIDTAAAGERFASQLVTAMEDTGTVLNTRPRRRAPLAVLNAADFPSVLLEVGFLSNPDDRARLTTAQGRAPIVAAVTLAVGRWAIEEAALEPLIRQ